MKLPDFSFHKDFSDLIKKMDADRISIEHDSEWERINIQLQQKGIDVSIEDIITCADKTFEYKGQKVIVYIRDQYSKFIEKGGYKFHISHCNTYDGMIKKKRHSRYVVSNRKDGKFVVNIMEHDEIKAEGLELALNVCKNCIETLKLNVTPNQFDINDFFKLHSDTIKKLPKHTEKTAPLNLYTNDWNTVSKQKKESASWTCEECSIDLKHTDHKQYLHVHHIDSDKSNNKRSNLSALCVACHANQPSHESMKNLPDYKEFQKKFLTRKGTIKKSSANARGRSLEI